MPARQTRPRYTISSADHHRRRRRVALLGIAALVALAVGVAAGSGAGGGTHTAKAGQLPSGWGARIQALGGNGRLSLALRQGAEENRAIDRVLAATPLVYRAGSQHREVALTFDDGPSPFTPRFLDVLRRLGVPATFFTLGLQYETFHAATQRAVIEGNVIGNHTWNHPGMSRLAPADQASQMQRTSAIMGGYGVPAPRLFRPPYGLYDAATLAAARQRGMLTVLWSVDTEDYTQPGVPALVQHVLSRVQPGGIVLMHDGGGQRYETLAALPLIVSGLRRAGYRLVTVPKLLLDNPPPANQAGFASGAGGA